MKYLKLYVKFKDYPDKLNRLIAVDPSINLYQLNIYIQLLIKTMFYHMSEFTCDEAEFIDKIWLDEYENVFDKKSFDYTKVRVSDFILNSKYHNKIFLYDTGEGYEFDLKEKGFIDLPFNRPVILLSGVGDGIFEDNITDLRKFFENEIDISDAYIWNIKIKNINNYDYFAPLNIDQINESLISEYKKVVKDLKKNDSYSDIY